MTQKKFRFQKFIFSVTSSILLFPFSVLLFAPAVVGQTGPDNNDDQTSPIEQPGVEQPGVEQPGMQQQPGVQQPGVQQPGVQQPGVQQPGIQQPGIQQQPGVQQQPGIQQQPGVQQQPGIQQQPGVDNNDDQISPVEQPGVETEVETRPIRGRG
jgi:hypothetical protein